MYSLVLAILSPFKTKARLRFKGNRRFLEVTDKRKPDEKLIWFHCASLGEFEQGRPVIERFKALHPNWQVLLTFFSPSGYEVRKAYPSADIVSYLPFDSKKNARLFLDSFKPDLAVFVKYEFWRNFLFETEKRGVPLLSISSIFRAEQSFFKPWGKFQRDVLGAVNYFFVQNALSERLLRSIGIENVKVIGDTRFDRVQDTLKTVKDIEEIKAFKNAKELMVCGSVWEHDMEVLIPFINNTNLKFVIAPHEINQKEIHQWKNSISRKSINYSELSDRINVAEFDVLFIDNVGMLSSLYQYGNYAFIGGAYGKGLHNILEAATFGMPIFFGNQKYHKFQEAVDLIEKKAAFPVKDSLELESVIQSVDKNEASKIAAEYVKNHTGATDVVLEYLEELISKL